MFTDLFRFALVAAVVACSGALTACSSKPAMPSNGPMTAVAEGLTPLPETTTRATQRAEFFAKEFRHINERRNQLAVTLPASAVPTALVGVAMSGGGIRSNAYHLGILAGLQGEKIGDHAALDRVDYLSSVSGGSWANLGLWAWPRDAGSLFECLDQSAEQGSANVKVGCRDAVKMLRTKQDVTLLSRPGHQRKRDWRASLEQAMTSDRLCNVLFDEPIPVECRAEFGKKPYPIFNSTHSASSEQASADNMPFQTTPDGVAAIVDEGSRYASGAGVISGPIGFALNFDSPKIKWKWRRFFSRHLPGGSDGEEDGSSMSLAAAHSSGVVKGPGLGLLLEYYMGLVGDLDVDTLRLRDKYKLSDGGKSDNTGAISLVERGVDILVISHMGKDDPIEDAGEGELFQDLQIAREQGEKLLGCDFDAINSARDHALAQKSSYRCSTGDTAARPVLHLHPWHGNINFFIEDLKRQADVNSGLRPVLAYLQSEKTSVAEENDRFPQTKTMITEYDEALIRAYYLLGRYVSKSEMVPFLRDALARP